MSRQPRLFEPEVPIPEELRPAAELWLKHKAERRETYKPTGLAMLLERMAELGPDRAMAAVRHSIANNWSGLFEPVKTGGVPAQDEDWDLQWSPGLRCCKCKTPGPATEQEAGGWNIWRENGKGSRNGLSYAPMGALRVLCPECR